MSKLLVLRGLVKRKGLVMPRQQIEEQIVQEDCAESARECPEAECGRTRYARETEEPEEGQRHQAAKGEGGKQGSGFV